MLSPDSEILKRKYLKDVVSLGQDIRSFVDQVCKTAEDAVDRMFLEAPDVLSNAAAAVSVLQECRDKLTILAGAIPRLKSDQPVSSIPNETLPSAPPAVLTKESTEKYTIATKTDSLEWSKTVQPALSLPKCHILPAKVEFGTPYHVQVLQSGSPSRFWLKLESSCSEQISTAMELFYSSAEPLNFIPTLGSYIICKYSGKFHRGKVVTSYQCHDQPTKLEIILVDSGDVVTVKYDQVYEIHECFCDEPAQGLLCRMFDLEPTNGHWEMDAVVFFISLCDNLIAKFHPPPTGKIEPFSKYETDFFVSLQSTSDEKVTDIGSLLIHNGMAVSKTNRLELVSNSAHVPLTSSTSNPVDVPSTQNFKEESHRNFGLTFRGLHSQEASPSRKPGEFRDSIIKADTQTSSTNINQSSSLQISRKKSNGSVVSENEAVSKSASKKSISLEQNAVLNVRTAKTPVSAHVIEADEDEEGVVTGHTDVLLMQQFLDSLVITPTTYPGRLDDSKTESFFTAASFNQSTERSEDCCTEQSSVSGGKLLQYEYGASLKPRPLPVVDDSTLNVMELTISHIQTPTHFYVHLQDEVQTLLDLTNFLNETYQDSLPVSVVRPNIGSFWVAPSQVQNAWVRVEIISVEESADDNIALTESGKPVSKNLCTVFQVDWGRVEIVAVSDLRPLISEILDIPCIAMRCRLADIYPYLCSPGFGEWSPAAIEMFKRLLGTQLKYIALINAECEEEGSVSIILFFDDSDENYSFNEILVAMRLASSHFFDPIVKQAVDRAAEDDLLAWNPMSDDFNSPNNTLQLDPENYDSVTTGYVPQDEIAICRFFRAKGRCRKGIRCNQLHVQPNRSGFTEDRSLMYVDAPTLPHLPIGELVSVQVTYVLNAYSFYAVLSSGTRKEPKDLRSTFSGINHQETLEQLQDALQKEYNQAAQKHRCVVRPSLSSIVIARSPEDHKWYRGRIMHDTQEDYFAVFFMDFGNLQEVHLKNMCNPLPRFMHLPAQAVEMHLNGIDKSPESHSPAATNTLIELVKERDLVARIVFDVPHVCVDLYDTSGAERIDIAAYLVKQNLIRPVSKIAPGNTYCGTKMIAG